MRLDYEIATHFPSWSLIELFDLAGLTCPGASPLRPLPYRLGRQERQLQSSLRPHQSWDDLKTSELPRASQELEDLAGQSSGLLTCNALCQFPDLQQLRQPCLLSSWQHPLPALSTVRA